MEKASVKNGRLSSIWRHRKWLLLALLLLLLLLAAFLYAPNLKPVTPSASPKAQPPEILMNTPLTTTALLRGGSVTIVQIETGVKVTVTNSSLPDGAMVKVTSIFYGPNPPAGTNKTVAVGIAYYDVKVTQESGLPLDEGAKISMYLSNPRFNPVNRMFFWNNGNWTSVYTTLVEVDTLLGPFKSLELMGTLIEVNDPSLITYPSLHVVPEVPVGTLAALAACAAAFAIFKKRTKKSQ